MSLFVRTSNSPSDKYGAIVYYVDNNGFVRKSNSPSDKYGTIVYYVDNNGFVRKSNSPSDKYGAIVYYVDSNGFVRKSNSPSDKYGTIVYYVDSNGFVRKSNSPSDKYGAIVYYVQKEQQKPQEMKGGILLALAFVIGLIFAPILIVLGMFGKFLLGGLFKNVLEIKAFKKFRKLYSIINFVWLGLGLAAVAVFAILEIDVTIALYALVGGNVLLFILSIVFGNKIYNKHKHELPPPPVKELAEESITETQVEESATEVLMEEFPNETPIEESTYNLSAQEKNENTSNLDRTYDALKKLKELLDIGAITKKEFENKKKEILGEGADASRKPKQISSTTVNKFKLANKILAILTVVVFIVGAIFLTFEQVPSQWAYQDDNWNYISYFEYAFAGGIAALLTIIFGVVYLLCLIPQTILTLQKNNHTLSLIIIGIFAILCATTSLIFAFISFFSEFALLYGILTSVSCGFLLIQVAITAILAFLKSSTVKNL